MNLADPQDLRKFLGKHGIRPEKALGQHFLCSQAVVNSVVDELRPCNGILEIGPGPGVLTTLLADRPGRLTAIELDDKMLALVRASSPYAQVVNQDALTASFESLLEPLSAPRAVVGNLPYYITGPLLNKIAEARSHYDEAVLMMQKEVAQRVAAVPGDSVRGSLSVFLQAQFDISVLCQVPADAFLPPPKVDSTVIRMIPKSLPVPEELAPDFFRIVRASFTQPRKNLLNNLIAGLAMDRTTASTWIARAGLTDSLRPHMLSMPDWVSLFTSR